MDQPDWQQLQSALADDRTIGLARLYDAAAPLLFRFIRRLTGDDEETADVLHDLFLNLTRAAPTLRAVRDFKAYLFTAARNGVHRRRRKTTSPGLASATATGTPSADPLAHAASREPDAAALADTRERDRMIERAVQQLPEDQREVLALKLDAELTFEEIGRQLNIPWPTAASRYRYALQALRHSLEAFRHDHA